MTLSNQHLWWYNYLTTSTAKIYPPFILLIMSHTLFIFHVVKFFIPFVFFPWNIWYSKEYLSHKKLTQHQKTRLERLFHFSTLEAHVSDWVAASLSRRTLESNEWKKKKRKKERKKHTIFQMTRSYSVSHHGHQTVQLRPLLSL